MPLIVAARAAPILVLCLTFKLSVEQATLAPPRVLRREAAHRWGGRGRGLPSLLERALGTLRILELLLLDAP
eukprot:12864860-Alexandrium_andersonii.AAC.1